MFGYVLRRLFIMIPTLLVISFLVFAIFAHVRQHLSPFKRVRRIEFAELPKTISGKIRRVELRKLEAERRGAKDYDPARRYPQEYWDEDFPELRSGTGAGAG